MQKLLKFFNLFSQKPSLRINGEIRPASIFGSIIGFFSILSTVPVIFYLLFEYFSRLNFTINSHTDNMIRPEIDLKKFKLGFALTDAMGREIPDADRLFQMFSKFWDLYVPEPGSNRSHSVKVQDVNFIKCNEHRNNTLFSDYFSASTDKIKSLSCLDLDTLNQNLTGAYGNLGL